MNRARLPFQTAAAPPDSGLREHLLLHEALDLGGPLRGESDVFPAPSELDPRGCDPVPVARRLGRRQRLLGEPLGLIEAALHERSHRMEPGDPGSIEGLRQPIGETRASSDLVVDLLHPPELEEVDEAPAMALEGQLELRGCFGVADDLVGDGEQLADFVLAALGPVTGVEREREGRGVTEPSGQLHALPRQRPAALRLVGEVKLHGQAARTAWPGPRCRSRAAPPSASSSTAMIAGSAVPCSIQPRPRPSAARARCSARPAVRASSAAVSKAERLRSNSLALLCDFAEAEQQVAAGRVVGATRRARAPRARG